MAHSETQHLEPALDKADTVIGKELARTRRQHRFLLLLALLTGTVATALAGSAAARGEAVASSWPLTCWIVAAFTATASLSTGLIQQLGLARGVAEREACLGRLHALAVALRLGGRAEEQLLQEYQEIVKDYPSCFSAVRLANTREAEGRGR